MDESRLGTTLKEFADKRGQPANLPFEGEKGSFSELVRRYSGDVPARAVLDELRRVEVEIESVDGGKSVLDGNDPFRKRPH